MKLIQSLSLICVFGVVVSACGSKSENGIDGTKKEPFEIKGIYSGMSESHLSVTAIETNMCRDELILSGQVLSLTMGNERGVCTPLTIANSPAQITVLLKDQVVEVVRFDILSRAFEDTYSALKGKYGDGDCKESEIHNGLGMSFAQRECTWRRGSEVLHITKYDDNLNRGYILLGDLPQTVVPTPSSKKPKDDI